MASAKQINFRYFELGGYAEIARLVLAFGKKPFNDIRVKWAEWKSNPAHKANTPFGTLPVLEVDGQIIPEGKAINYYLAREFGLIPASNHDQLTTDIVYSLYDQINRDTEKFYDDKPSAEKDAKIAKAKGGTPKYLAYLEGLLAKNGGKGYFVGDSVTFADLVLHELIIGYTRYSLVYSADKYPLIAKTLQNVLKVPQVKKYVDTRPASSLDFPDLELFWQS